ncbi:MAG TPA: efflux RND transporter periplasmic adaptor subunit [Capsulimonadaceae bacterium]
MKTRTHFALITLGFVAVLLAGCHKPDAEKLKSEGPAPAVVSVAPVQRATISNSIAVTGNLDTLSKTILSAKTTGRVIAVNAREGDRVSRGQVLAQLDPTEVQANVNQSLAALQSNEVKVTQAVTQYKQSISNAQIAVNTARSQVEAAQSNLKKVMSGGRPEEKQQAKDQLLQQQANYDNAHSNYQRQLSLFKQGAISKADLDNAETTFKVQSALLDSYKQAVSISQQGGRPEDIASAQETVRQANLALSNAVANQGNVKVNRDAIVVAQAAVAQARAQVAAARQQLSDLTLRSPINGYVTARTLDPGQTASPGTAILTIVDLRSVYYQPTFAESDFRHIRPGQTVAVTVDAYPGRSFVGRVNTVFPTASQTARQFSVRVLVDNPNDDLRPGMFARGSITTQVHRDAVVVPLTALVPRDQTTTATETSYGTATGGVGVASQKVFITTDGKKAISRNVEVGIQTADTAEITSGLSGGEKLIVKGHTTLSDNAPIKIVNAKTGESAE